MSEPFLGQISIFAFEFSPRGWAFCNGQLLPINQNQALFALLGTIYGGDGRTTFALPDFRGRAPMHANQIRSQGEKGGLEAHTLGLTELPAHGHSLLVSSAVATTVTPATSALGVSEAKLYAAPGSLTPMKNDALTLVGGGAAHTNMQPFLTLNFCIALTGIFPSRN